VEVKFNELGDMCERGELEPEKAYELFKEFEDQMVAECTELIEAEEADMPTKEDAATESGSKKVVLDDPPGEGPVLRWESRIVFAHGGDAWHPKNRKVKLSVTVKELALSRHAFRRLREVVGKRYNSGKDELTITSERYGTSSVIQQQPTTRPFCPKQVGVGGTSSVIHWSKRFFLRDTSK
jgi:small subunit ribosomal protein S35